MPRSARKKSASGIYHVMLRGINQQLLFEDDEDFAKFLSLLKEYKDKCGYKLYAYCLMSNHVHLIIKEEAETLAKIIGYIGMKYAYWYNTKYGRAGHLFQDRFKSETIIDNAYFLTAVRYVHQNPVKAGMCEGVADYTYSSYAEYAGKQGITDTDFALEILSRDNFIRFNNEKNGDKCLDIPEGIVKRLTDEEARKIILKISDCDSVTEFEQLDRTLQAGYVSEFRDSGMSIRQISRLTGVPKGMVERWTKD